MAGGMLWAAGRFLAANSSFTAWLTYGSRSLPIIVCSRLPACEPRVLAAVPLCRCPCGGLNDPSPCRAAERFA